MAEVFVALSIDQWNEIARLMMRKDDYQIGEEEFVELLREVVDFPEMAEGDHLRLVLDTTQSKIISLPR